LGPYLVEKFHDNGLMWVYTIDEEQIPLLVNFYRLKFYKKPLLMDDFTNLIRKELNVIESIRAPNSFNL